MASLTIENYVKAIYLLTAADEHSPAATGALAAALNVMPGTVTSMLKTLSEAGLARYTPYEGARLTEAGWALAVRMVRRHRLMELFLARTLELTWDQVHEEAENLEHAVSDWLIDRIDEHLGYPSHDPHGDPIPAADGSIRTLAAGPLSELAVGERFRLVRVLDQTSEFLRFLSESGIAIGSQGHVAANHRTAGTLQFEIAGRSSTLSHAIAAKLLVERLA